MSTFVFEKNCLFRTKLRKHYQKKTGLYYVWYVLKANTKTFMKGNFR